LPGIEAALTSDEILFLPVFPRRLVIVGAGAIGLEMAGAFSDFGAEVVVVGQDHEILPAFDRDVAGYLRKILESRGVTSSSGRNAYELLRKTRQRDGALHERRRAPRGDGGPGVRGHRPPVDARSAGR
jgi:pyruvate/2-oxoglutarate dehydrogenase complex dihydrolipoamide dehydrogenase (E3) component